MTSSGANDSPIDLVCWDFGDTIVDELFMRLAPEGCPEWPEAYAGVVADHAGLFDELNLGRASMNELIDVLAPLVSTDRPAIARHIRLVWHQIHVFPESAAWMERLSEAGVLQAIVTVNPHEFHGMAVACGIDRLVEAIVTSAELATLSKPIMAERARSLLGLEPSLATTLLIDNKEHNTDDFVAAGGQTILYTPESFDADADRWLAPLVV